MLSGINSFFRIKAYLYMRCETVLLSSILSNSKQLVHHQNYLIWFFSAVSCEKEWESDLKNSSQQCHSEDHAGLFLNKHVAGGSWRQGSWVRRGWPQGEPWEPPRDSPAELVALYSFLSRWWKHQFKYFVNFTFLNNKANAL